MILSVRMHCDLTVIILTKNEERHLERCIKSFNQLPARIVIVDSFSTDRTLEIAKAFGVDIYQREFKNHAEQFQWAIENTFIQTKWTMRMDADEIWDEFLSIEIKERLPLLPQETTGVFLTRKVYFMNRWLKHGGVYPSHLLRIWRSGKAHIENRYMDEHMVIDEGTCVHFKNHIIDHNLNGITWWTQKHNWYSSREMLDSLNKELAAYKTDKSIEAMSSSQAAKRRFIKDFIYAKLPLGLRAFLYFLYRYIFKLGFLDGRPGFVFSVLQGFWYRFLVDVKIAECREQLANGRELKEVLNSEHNIKL